MPATARVVPMIDRPMPASPQKSSSLTIGKREPGRVEPELGDPLEAVEADLRRLLDDRPGGLLALVPLWAAGRTTFSAKPWTQSRISFWSSFSSSEKVASPAWSPSRPPLRPHQQWSLPSLHPIEDYIDRWYIVSRNWLPASRGYKSHIAAPKTVIKDTGARATIPPFTDEHAELRETIARWVARGDRPPRRRVGAGAGVPARALQRARASSGSSASSTRWSWAGRAATASTTRSGPRSSRAAGASGGVGAGLGAHTGIATPPVFKFGTPDQHERFLRAGDPGRADRRPRHHRAGRRLGRRVDPHQARKVDGGYVVNGSKTFITNGVRADFLVCAVQDDRRGRPPRASRS